MGKTFTKGERQVRRSEERNRKNHRRNKRENWEVSTDNDSCSHNDRTGSDYKQSSPPDYNNSNWP